MSAITMSSREFTRHIGKAKKAASKGQVFVTEGGRPTHVLLSIEQYQALAASSPDIIDLLAMPGTESVPFKPRRLRGLIKPAAPV